MADRSERRGQSFCSNTTSFLFSVRSVISSVYTEQPKLRYKSGYELTLSIWNRTLYFFFWQLYCIVQLGFLPRGIRVAFPGESQLRQSRATKPTVHAGLFSVSIISRTWTWTTCVCDLFAFVNTRDLGLKSHPKASTLNTHEVPISPFSHIKNAIGNCWILKFCILRFCKLTRCILL